MQRHDREASIEGIVSAGHFYERGMRGYPSMKFPAKLPTGSTEC
jgi:hypothetical protein